MVSVWVAVSLVAFMVILGIGVDFAGHAVAAQDARHVAAEAARAGGQHLRVEAGRARPDVHAAIGAANSYAATAGYSAATNVRGGDTIAVTVTGHYACQFLSMIGITALPVTGDGTAVVKSVIEGAEQ